jgi:predicted nucleotidyltransferase
MNFASPGSDYDIRFFHKNRIEVEQRGVITTPIEDGFDVNGWHLKKAVELVAGGNVVPYEWISSPIRYRETALAERLRDAAAKAFDPRAAYRHYIGMAHKYCRIALSAEPISPKSYLHAARPLLACLHLLEHGGIGPMSLPVLVEAVAPAKAVREALAQVVLARREGAAQIGRVPTLDRWFKKTLHRLRTKLPPKNPSCDTAALHALAASFRQVDVLEI